MTALVVADRWGKAMADARVCILVVESGRGAVAMSDEAMVDRLVVMSAEMMDDQRVVLWAVVMGKSMVGS